MSSDNPPYPYYNGIPFNPSFFTSTTDTGSGLSETAANALYLRKTTPDTATALETFNGGIVAPSLSSTGSLDIVMPNALASNVLNVGVVSRNISGQVHHYSDGDGCVAGANVHLNNGINNASNTNISNGTTTTGQVNIMTGASSTGTTTIGTTGTTIGLNGATTITGSTTIAGTTNINTSNGLNTSIGTVTTGTTQIRGATISLTNVNTVNIGTSPPPDNTRAINIGGVNGANTSLISTFGRVTAVGVTNINTSGTANTSIGVAGSTTAILGETNINTSGSSNTSIGVAGFGNISLKGQNVSITETNAVNIQTSTASDNTKTLTLGNTNGVNTTLTTVNGRLTTVGTANINTSGTSNTSIGVSGSTTTILGATNINASGGGNTVIGTTLSGQITARAGTVFLEGIVNINGAGSTLTQAITIGNPTGSSNTTLSSPTITLGGTTSNIALGALTGAGATTVNKPLTIAYPVPTSTSQLGYFNASTMIWTTSATTKITSSPSLPVGVYLVSLALATFGTFVKNFVYFESATVGGCAPVNNNVIAFDDSTDRNVCNGNCILNITTAGIFDIKNFAANAQTLDASATMRIVRLA